MARPPPPARPPAHPSARQPANPSGRATTTIPPRRQNRKSPKNREPVYIPPRRYRGGVPFRSSRTRVFGRRHTRWTLSVPVFGTPSCRNGEIRRRNTDFGRGRDQLPTAPVAIALPSENQWFRFWAKPPMCYNITYYEVFVRCFLFSYANRWKATILIEQLYRPIRTHRSVYPENNLKGAIKLNCRDFLVKFDKKQSSDQNS